MDSRKCFAFCALFITITMIPAFARTKKWNFMVHVAANNNLYRYALHNIKQMKKVGSTKYMNIFVQLDRFGKKEVTRYKIEKDKSVELKTITTPPESVSGTKENLVGFVRDVLKQSSADHNALILWNHGSGIVDPHIWGKGRGIGLRRDDCFYFNPESRLFEINQDVQVDDFLDITQTPTLGIAFNDAARTYLTNDELKSSLAQIQSELMNGKKFDIIAADACHMAMAEFCTLIKPFAKLFVGSEEIEPGAGWNYTTFLKPLAKKCPTPEELAIEIASAYGKEYNNIFASLTQSAIDLEKYEDLEKSIDKVGSILIELLTDENHKDFLGVLSRLRKSRKEITSFIDRSYVDLQHFYKSLKSKASGMISSGTTKNPKLLEKLVAALEEGLTVISNCVIYNYVGKNITNVGGLSIYFPTKSIHSSYLKTDFAKSLSWCNFLYAYLKSVKRSLFGAPYTSKMIPPAG